MYIEGSKGKIVPVDSMKVYRGRRGVASLILNLGVRWRCVVNIALPPFPG
jgi:hypothetical protein